MENSQKTPDLQSSNLPDAADRELVGRAANLSDAQINELAKLPTGIGAIYQNDWQEPVLCKINYKTVEGRYVGKGDFTKPEDVRKEIIYVLLSKVAGEKIDDVSEFETRVLKAQIPGGIKSETLKCLRKESLTVNDVKMIIHDLCVTPDAIKNRQK